MFKSYNGSHDKIDEFIESKSLSEIKNKIELAMGENFDDYMTSWIMEYNIIGRHSAQHYFSMKDKKWHRMKVSITSDSSWSGAVSPLREIARYFIKVLGYKEKQDKQLNEWIRKSKIEGIDGI